MSYRCSPMQRAVARLSSFICRPHAWLLMITLVALLPNAAHAACGAMNVPDAFTTPSTSPMVSGGTITISVGTRCDGFGLNPYPGTGTTNPSHGTVSVNTITGTVTYTNNGDGATSDSFVVADGSAQPFTVNVAIGAATSPITVSPASLPTPHVGTAYSQTLSASGGTAPYSYAVTSGSLPPGLSLSGATISGTPNQAGGYTATITVTDNVGTTGTKSYTANVPIPTIAIAAPPTANLNTAYSYDLNANTSGALAPYTYVLLSGSLPPGLSLSGGVISGTPTAVGTSSFVLHAVDSSPNIPGVSPGPYASNVNLSITVQNVPPTAGSVSATVAYGSTNNPITLNLTGAPATSVAVTTVAAHGTATASGTSITYTPTTGYAGPDSFTYTATNGAGTSTPATVTITVSPPTILYTPAAPPHPTAGVAYNHSIANASGGAAPYTYTMFTGVLPAGLTLASNGTISGTSAAVGTFTFKVVATDNSTGTGPFTSAPADVTLIVDAPIITLAPSTLPGGTVNTAYSQTITATGGTAPYTTYTVIAGMLPTGITLSSGGVLSGTPTQAGSFNITVTATDSTTGPSAPYSGSRAYTLTIAGPTITVSPGTLPDGAVGTNYSQTLSAAGGTAPYSFAATGSLPPGLALNAGGTLSGTPTAAGDFTFTAIATDTQSFTGSQAYTVHVAAIAPGAPTIGTAMAGDTSAIVSFTPPASDGGSPITGYTVTSSPGGITATGAASPITVSGLTNGTAYTFTVTATNSVGISVASAASNSVTPKGAQTITFNNPSTQSFGTSPTLMATASSGLTPTFTSTTTGVCTITSGGTLTFISAGTCTIDADQAGDGTYLAAPTVTQSFTVAAVVPGAPTIGAATAGDAGASVSFTPPASNGGAPITGYAVTSSPGGFTGSGAGSPILVTGLTNGTAYTFTVTATNSAGTGAASAASNSVTPKGAQTITFGNPGTQNFDTTPTLTATASSGLTPTFTSSTTGVCTITSGGALTFISTGTCSIDADQAGNGTYLAAPTVTQSFTVAADVPGAPTIGTATAGDAGASVSFTPPASNGGAPITGYAVTSSPGGFTGSGAGSPILVTGLTNGTAYTFTVTATNSAGTGAASAASNSVTPMGAQTITFGNPGATNFGTAPQLAATASSGLAVTFSSSTTAVCTVTSTGILTTVSPGTCSIDANQAGDGTYLAAPTVTQSFAIVVSGGAVSIGTGALPQGTAGTAYSQTIIATGGATPYAFAVSAGTLPAGLTLDGAGLLSGTTTVAGHFSFTVKVTDAATQTATQTFTLDVQAPTIALSPSTLPAGTLGSSYAQTLGASGGQGAYTYAVSAGSLPAGLSLSSAGALGGTPTAAGSSSFTITATDGLGFTGSQAYTLTIEQPAPIANDDTASAAANGMATIAVTSNDRGGPITSIAIAQQPTHGTATISGLDVLYTPAANYFGNDTLKYTATGPGGTSAAATVSITVVAGVVPVATAKNATVLAGKPVTIHAAAGASNGPFTTATVVNAPTSGTATVQGTDIIYTADPDASGTLGFDYTLSNAFGTSQAAHVTLTINPRPVAPALTATAAAGTTVQVDLTAGAHGGPFTAAKVVSISPAHAGSATIASTGGGYTLAFTSAATFDGVAQITYTLSNAYATSVPGTVDVTVELRSDPSKNAEVLGVLEAQAEAARRMAMGQIGNFQRRLESLHGGGSRAGFSNGITMNSASSQRRTDTLLGMQQQVMGGGGDPFLLPADAPATDGAASSGDTPNGLAFWTGGAANFGKLKPGASYNGVDFTTSGLSLGADKQVTQALALGLGVGYGHDASDIGQHGSRSTVDSYNVAAYGSYQPGESAYMDVLAGYQWLQFDARRFVTDNGNTVRGSRDGKQWFASFSVGYRHQADDMMLTPYGRLDVARATLDGYTETGDTVFALSYQGQTVKTSTGTVGLLAQWAVKRDYGVWAPQLRAEFGHDLQGSSQATMRYADLLSGPLYQATLARQSRNHTLLGAGIALQTLKGWSLRVEYQNQLDNTSRDNQSILLGVQKTLPP